MYFPKYNPKNLTETPKPLDPARFAPQKCVVRGGATVSPPDDTDFVILPVHTMCLGRPEIGLQHNNSKFSILERTDGFRLVNYTQQP